MFLCFYTAGCPSIAVMWVEESYTVAKVKDLIKDKARARGFTPRPFGLMFAGLKLEDGSTLSDYNIVPTSLILIHAEAERDQIYLKGPIIHIDPFWHCWQ